MAVNREGTELGWLGGGGELLMVDAMRLRQVPRPLPYLGFFFTPLLSPRLGMPLCLAGLTLLR